MSDIFEADFLLQCIMVGCCIAAVIMMEIAQREYKPLHLWFIGSIFLISGETFSVITINIPSFLLETNLSYIVAILILFTNSIRDYQSLTREIHSGQKITPLLSKTAIFLPLFS